MGKSCVIFDIDGTLADVGHRRHFVSHGRRNWDEFFSLMAHDPLIDAVAKVNYVFAENGCDAIVLCSGRPENYRAVTEEWLARHFIEYEALYMRPEGDCRPDHIVKSQLLDGMIADGYDPYLVIDDRPSVVQMWRGRGLTCLQADPQGFEASETPGQLTLMVGPSGAGKTTWLREKGHKYGIHQTHIVSSDRLRVDLCGGQKDQSKNDAVFAALHALVRLRVVHGLPVTVDATNLRKRDRRAITDLVPPGADIRYIVLNRPMDIKREQGGWRNELPIDLLAKQENTFNSQLRDILEGDGLPNVQVLDLRKDM